MGLLPDTLNWGLRMRRECRERFPRHRLQSKPLVSDPSMHHGTCVTHVPWCMSGSLTSGGGENAPGIPSACATRNFAYRVRGPLCLYNPYGNYFTPEASYYIEHIALLISPKCMHVIHYAVTCWLLFSRHVCTMYSDLIYIHNTMYSCIV